MEGSHAWKGSGHEPQILDQPYAVGRRVGAGDDRGVRRGRRDDVRLHRLLGLLGPTNGVYVITAYGAQGGSNDFLAGGLGAEAGGYIPLSAGTMLAVIAGGEGAPEAGGGGSFVFNITDGSYLVAAGGGRAAVSVWVRTDPDWRPPQAATGLLLASRLFLAA